MSVFWIAWKSIKHRGFASVLTIASMTLGVMLVVSVLTIHGVVKRSFSNNGEVGYDLIIGAKGGNLQLALNSVYYLSQPVETIPYEYLMAFKDQSFREKEIRHSIHYKAHRSRVSILEANRAHHELMGLGGPAGLASELTLDAYDQKYTAATGMFDDGLFEAMNYVDFAIPILLGDYFDEFRVVATTSDFFDDRLLEFPEGDGLNGLVPEDGDGFEDDDGFAEFNSDEFDGFGDEPTSEVKSYEELQKVRFEFAEGRALEDYSETNQHYECVLGYRVAKETKKGIGDTIKITHGVPASEGGDAALHAGTSYIVVGVLKQMNRPEDRVAFVNMEGFFVMNDHANEMMTDTERDATATDEDVQRDEESRKAKTFAEQLAENRLRLPLEQRRISCVLLASATDRGLSVCSPAIHKNVNKGYLDKTTDWTDYPPPRLQKAASAIFPIAEIDQLFVFIVTPIQTVLLILTFMICVVSGISILVSIYNSMSDRRHEIAVMRALGANQANVFTIILVESSMLGLFGLGLGWILGHGLIALSSPYVDSYAGVSVGFFDLASPINEYLAFIPFNISAEFFLLPGILILTVLVGLVPAVSAYRTDVSQNLGK